MATHDPTTATVPCSACRGTGKVISNLGGSPSEMVCPWCDGSGTRLGADHDAQASQKAAREGKKRGDEPPDQAA